MKITVRYFASIREAMGKVLRSLGNPGRHAGAVARRADCQPDSAGEALARGRTLRMALNQVMSDESAALTDGCEVAFFPPVTGG